MTNILSFIEQLDKVAVEQLGNNFYCKQGDNILVEKKSNDFILNFIEQVKQSFEVERDTFNQLKTQNLVDYVICGGGSEHHELKKEVNFSDTLINNSKLCRMPGSNRGRGWSSVNTHGWFSYLVKVKKGEQNTIVLDVGSQDQRLDFNVDINGQSFRISQENNGDKEFSFNFTSLEDNARIRLDRISEHTPLFYSIKVL